MMEEDLQHLDAKDALEILRADLTEAVQLLRSHAAKVGPQHAWWDDIFNFEEHLRAFDKQHRDPTS
jgi:hypothetical protein